MDKKIEFTKAELKNPDKVLANLKTGFEWSAAHSKAVLTFLAIFIFIGGGWAVYSIVQQQTEDKLQESFYLAEKKYIDLRKKLEEAQAPKVNEKDKAAANATKKNKPPEAVIKPSANPDVDYAGPIKELKELTAASPSSKAALMSALFLSEIYSNSSKLEEALQSLDPVTKGTKVNGLLSALAIKTKGNFQADLNQCAEAVQTWQRLNQNSDGLSFLTADVKLKMALCYEKMDQIPQAEIIYKELIDRVKNPGQQVGNSPNSSTDQIASREAEKFLRLLKLKKDQRGS